MLSKFQDAREMQQGWNARAARDPFFYVETTYWDGDVDHFFERGENTAHLLIDRLQSQYGSAREVALDLGCGLGRFSRALSRRFASVIAVDVSDKMIAAAKQLHTDSNYSNITFETNNGVNLQIADNTVDFAWSYEVFQHMPNHEIIGANIAEIGRVLRPGGLAMIHFKTSYQRPAVQAIISHLPQWAATLAVRVARKDPMMADRSFRGSPPLGREQIGAMFCDAELELIEVINDPTHASGTRGFALASKPVSRVNG